MSMGLWIESHTSLARHPKTRKLCRILGVATPAVIGHLHLLWHWAMEYAPEGSLAGLDAADIAEGAMWDGDPDVFVQGLLQCGASGEAGFLNADYTLHDWYDYAGKLLEKRKSDAERKRRERGHGEVQRPADVPTQDVRRMSEGHPRDGAGNRTVTVPESLSSIEVNTNNGVNKDSSASQKKIFADARDDEEDNPFTAPVMYDGEGEIVPIVSAQRPHPPRGRPPKQATTPAAKPEPKPRSASKRPLRLPEDFSTSHLWALLTEEFGRLTWSGADYAREGQAVETVVNAGIEGVTEADIVAFLRYIRRCDRAWKSNGAEMPLLSKHRAQFGAWWAAGKPEQPNEPKGGYTNGHLQANGHRGGYTAKRDQFTRADAEQMDIAKAIAFAEDHPGRTLGRGGTSS